MTPSPRVLAYCEDFKHPDAKRIIAAFQLDTWKFWPRVLELDSMYHVNIVKGTISPKKPPADVEETILSLAYIAALLYEASLGEYIAIVYEKEDSLLSLFFTHAKTISIAKEHLPSVRRIAEGCEGIIQNLRNGV